MDEREFEARLTRAAQTEQEPPSAGLQQRVLADYDRVAARRDRSWLRAAGDWIWPGASIWQPAAALAVSLAMGVLAGALTPFENPFDSDAPSVTTATASDVPNDLNEGFP